MKKISVICKYVKFKNVTLEYLAFLKLHVIPRFTGTGILPVPVNRNRGILTSLMFHCGPVAEHVVLWTGT